VSEVLVVAPLGVEALAIRSRARGLRVRTTGMGPQRALAAVPALSRDPASALLVLGFGGGLAADSRLCEVVVAERVLALDERGATSEQPLWLAGAEALAAALADSLSGVGLSVRRGTVASVQEIVTGDARERMLASGAVAVDMESAWVARAARGRPVAVVRVLSDTPAQELRQRLPVGPPLPTLANGLRAVRALRQVAGALETLRREGNLHTVLGVSTRAREV
jgi:4-hydroxy-3-methylbut-2-en-1-yl diphosphate reductase